MRVRWACEGIAQPSRVRSKVIRLNGRTCGCVMKLLKLSFQLRLHRIFRFWEILPLMSARRGATDFLLEKTKPSNFLSAETARDPLSFLEDIIYNNKIFTILCRLSWLFGVPAFHWMESGTDFLFLAEQDQNLSKDRLQGFYKRWVICHTVRSLRCSEWSSLLWRKLLHTQGSFFSRKELLLLRTICHIQAHWQSLAEGGWTRIKGPIGDVPMFFLVQDLSPWNGWHVDEPKKTTGKH